jgi:hypothetical protein
MTETDSVLVERDGAVTIVSINRPHCRNAVDGATARKLYDAFLAFDADESASVAVFTGTGGYFCAGADLKAVAAGDPNKKRELGGHGSIAPMGPSRLRLSKPVIAAFPQKCLRADRLSALRQWDLSEEEATDNEMRGGLAVIASGETLSGATRFASGIGRHGAFASDASD